MTEAQDAAKAAFEQYLPRALQAAVNFVDGDPRIDRIWLYTETLFGGVATYVFYRRSGKVVNADAMEEENPGGSYDLAGFYEEVLDASTDLASALADLPQPPQRIVTEYHPGSGEVDASWDHDAVGEGESGFAARERWVASLG